MPQPRAEAQYPPSSASVTSKMISDVMASACLADSLLSKPHLNPPTTRKDAKATKFRNDSRPPAGEQTFRRIALFLFALFGVLSGQIRFAGSGAQGVQLI